MKQILKSFFLLLFLMSYIMCDAQMNLVTVGNNVGGGNSIDKTFDFSIGENITYPVQNSTIAGNVGILQVGLSEMTSNENLLESIVNIYPNPATTTLQVMLSCESSYNLRLLAIDGKVIHKQSDVTCQSDIDMTKLQQGIYLLEVSNNLKSKTFKIVKQ